jgi:hypothetical protein
MATGNGPASSTTAVRTIPLSRGGLPIAATRLLNRGKNRTTVEEIQFGIDDLGMGTSRGGCDGNGDGDGGRGCNGDGDGDGRPGGSAATRTGPGRITGGGVSGTGVPHSHSHAGSAASTGFAAGTLPGSSIAPCWGPVVAQPASPRQSPTPHAKHNRLMATPSASATRRPSWFGVRRLPVVSRRGRSAGLTRRSGEIGNLGNPEEAESFFSAESFRLPRTAGSGQW